MTDRSLTFGIQTPRSLLTKLERELSRVAKSSSNRKDLTDHALNCALTAWHIVDWVWKNRFSSDKTACDTILSGHGNLTGNGRAGKFKEALARDCDALALCRDVSNGIKHLATAPPKTMSRRADDTSLSATAKLSGTYSIDDDGVVGGGLPDGAGQVVGETVFRPKIISDGQRHDAIVVFSSVVKFWRRFMDTWDIG